MSALDTLQNTMFYVSSSVAGTFGSAVGIIVAAAIFRLQRIEQNAYNISRRLNEYHPPGEAQDNLCRISMAQHWEKYCRYWRDLHPDDKGKQINPEKLWWLVNEFNITASSIRAETSYLVKYTLCLIAGCFILIGGNHLVSLGGEALCYFAVVCVIGPACGCLHLYGRLAKLLFESSKDYPD